MIRFAALFAAFAIGATSAAVTYERTIADLRVQVETVYHIGESDGYANGRAECARDCRTMGNRMCGPGATVPDTARHTTR